MDISKVRALTFDTGGTILDWYSGFKSGFEEVANKNGLSLNANELSKEFRKKSLGIITQQDHNNLINNNGKHSFHLGKHMSTTILPFPSTFCRCLIHSRTPKMG